MTSLSGKTPTVSDHQNPQFGVVSDTSDHHFLRNKTNIPCSSSVQKKIMKEWKLLSKDLPETIFVRVYETRVDLLRAAIVGARGTPYHDGLFFFDVAFPADYPAHPPLVHYRSFGFRINPNLYCNGTVCLSLLNTWSGTKCERWDPNNSTILQLLLSIQALILNEKPYFNEPAWVGRLDRERESLAYSEQSFILTCKSTLCLLRNPPKNFKPVVTQHFKDRAEFILNACYAYRNGFARVGCFNGVVEGTKFKGKVSGKLKGSIDGLYADLLTAMSKTGASVKHLTQQARTEEENKARKEAATAAAGGGSECMINFKEIGRSFVDLLKKIVFLRSNQKKNKSHKSKG